MTTKELLQAASDCIDLFLEYRDKHGYSEEAAKAAALNELLDSLEYCDEEDEP